MLDKEGNFFFDQKNQNEMQEFMSEMNSVCALEDKIKCIILSNIIQCE